MAGFSLFSCVSARKPSKGKQPELPAGQTPVQAGDQTPAGQTQVRVPAVPAVPVVPAFPAPVHLPGPSTPNPAKPIYASGFAPKSIASLRASAVPASLVVPEHVTPDQLVVDDDDDDEINTASQMGQNTLVRAVRRLTSTEALPRERTLGMSREEVARRQELRRHRDREIQKHIQQELAGGQSTALHRADINRPGGGPRDHLHFFMDAASPEVALSRERSSLHMVPSSPDLPRQEANALAAYISRQETVQLFGTNVRRQLGDENSAGSSSATNPHLPFPPKAKLGSSRFDGNESSDGNIRDAQRDLARMSRWSVGLEDEDQ